MKIVSRLLDVAFFVGGDLIYGLFSFGHERSTAGFFGTTIVVLLFFVLHKLDKVFQEQAPSKKLASKQKRYTGWLLSAILGAGFAFASNGSTLLRWINLSN